MKIRIDPQKSPLHEIPVDLRKPLLEILVEHARGIVIKSGLRWKDININQISGLRTPYPFETSPAHGEYSDTGQDVKSTFLWGNLTWPEAEDYLKKVDVAILPVGAIEQHGTKHPVLFL